MNCPKHDSCAFFVPPEGPSGARLALIGEGPGEQEVKAKRPFVGPSGAQLNSALEDVGLKREEALVLNAVPCFGGPIRTPTESDIRAWKPHVLSTLLASRPNVIVAVGAWALYLLTGKKGIKVNHNVERRVRLADDYEPWVVPMLHPAYLMRVHDYQPMRTALAKVKRLLENVKLPDWMPGYTLVDDEFVLMEAVNELSAAPLLAIDVETVGTPYKDALQGTVMLGIGEPGKNPYVFPLNHPEASKEMYPCVVEGIKEIFRRNTGEIIGHNAKYDAQRLKLAGLMILDKKCPTLDTMYIAHLLDESRADRGRLKLKEMGTELFGIDPYWRRQIDVTVTINGKTKAAKAELADLLKTGRALEIPLSMLSDYNARDVYLTLKLFEHLYGELQKDPQLVRVLRDLVMPASWAMERMERVGLPVDLAKIAELESQYEQEHSSIIQELDNIVLANLENEPEEVLKILAGGGSRINWSSSAQVGRVLYDRLKLPVVRRTPPSAKHPGGQPSTDDDTLAVLQDAHPIVPVLRNMRRVKKASETVQTLKDSVAPDGRIHATFVLAGPSTGRTSSRDPNMQNLPRGPGIRDIIRAEDGKSLCEVDLGLIEMRWGAYIYKEPTMTRLLRAGKDLHTYTAAMAFGCSESEVTGDMRQLGKTANFLMLYGGGPKKLMTELRSKGFSNNQAMQALVAMNALANVPDPTFAVAVNMHKAFHKAYPAIRPAHAVIGTAIRKDKQVRSVFGRVRHIPEIDDSDYEVRDSAQRAGSNTLVQGPASDTNLLGFVRVCNLLIDKHGAEVIDSVHDSLLAEVPNERIEEFAQESIYAVTHPDLQAFGITDFNIPIEAEAKVGQSWGSMKKMTTTIVGGALGATEATAGTDASAIARAELTAAPVPVEQYSESITDMYAAAELYRSRGWSFIPLTSPRDGSGNDTSVGKTPAVPGWKQYQTRMPTPEEQIMWFAARTAPRTRLEPPHNIAVISGSLSNLVIVDVDTKHDGEKWIKETGLDSTAKVRTGGGGLHLYFRRPEAGLKNSAGKLAPGVDFRGDGGYVVAPPSVHLSGNRYKWISSNGMLPTEIPPLPEWVIEKLDAASPELPVTIPTSGERVIPLDKIQELVNFLLPYYVKGQRHYMQLAIAGYLAKRNYRYEDVGQIVASLSTAVGDDGNFDKLANRVLRDTYDKSQRGESVSGASALVELIGVDPLQEMQNLFGSVHASGAVRTFTARQIAEQEIKQEDWLIEGLLPRAGFAMLSGHAGSGKTTFVIQMGLQMAAGEHVFGDKPTKPARILYFQADNPPNMVRRLIKDMITLGRVPVEAADNFIVAEVIKPIKVTDPEGYQILEQHIAMYSPDLLIFDTIRDFHSSDENNPTAVAETIDTLKRLRGTRSMGVMYIHHHSKSTGFERLAIERHMGSIRFVTPVDLAMSLTLPIDDASKVKLSFTKVRWAPKPPSRLFRRVRNWYEDEGPAMGDS